MSLSHELSPVHRDLMDGRVRLSRIGAVAAGTSMSLPWLLVDGAGREVEPVSSYLRDRLLGDVSPLTCRSYARPRRSRWSAGCGRPATRDGTDGAKAGTRRGRCLTHGGLVRRSPS